MNIREALEKRIPRIRMPQWADSGAYLRLPLLPDGLIGLWAELYDPAGQKALDVRVGSHRVLLTTDLIFNDRDDYVEYTGQPHRAEQDTDNILRMYTES